MSEPFPVLILASRSPQRRELLAEAGHRFEVCPASDFAESGIFAGESPADFVARLAYQKAADVAARLRAGWILGCDTVAECDGQVLGKPIDVEHARSMLRALSGRLHRVLTGLCLWKLPRKTPQIAVATTTLRMDPLSHNQIEDYLSGGQWEGKAGAFGYQDGLDWIHIVAGSPSNVVGLPLELLATMLSSSA